MNEATPSPRAETGTSSTDLPPLERAQSAARNYCRRVYMSDSPQATLETLKDFTFEPQGPHRISVSRRRPSKESTLWCTASLDTTDATPRVRIEGHDERIDAILVMLSYFAICNSCPLDYKHPVLQQGLHAEPDGTLSLNG